MNFDNKHCLITGASGGIGQALAQALHQAGVRLILTGRDIGEIQKLNIELGGKHQCLVSDIASTRGREAIIKTIINDTSINLIVQAAGTSSFGQLHDLSAQELEHSIAVNLLAPMLITQGIVKVLSQRGPCTIVNVGSAFGSIGFPCFSTYCAGKFGLRGFTEALQREYAGTNMNVCHFAPRATQTGFNSQAIDEMNRALGNGIDSPGAVAKAFMAMLKKDQKRRTVGWPEKLLCRVNGMFPELVDNPLRKKRKTIIHFAEQHMLEGIPS
ncbi:MAG: SDR family oxidoreductase [Pseudomonadales bacterium]